MRVKAIIEGLEVLTKPMLLHTYSRPLFKAILGQSPTLESYKDQLIRKILFGVGRL